MLRLEGVSVRYGSITAVAGISLEVKRDEIVGLWGPNGAGKSTLMNAISGLVPLSGGHIYWNDTALDRLAAFEVARAGVIQCPEGRRVFAEMSVGENLQIGGMCRGLGAEALQEELAFITQLFPILKERWHQYAGTLSGGEQQMAALARSLLARPVALLLDEPGLGLAPAAVDALVAILPRIAARGVAVLVADQTGASQQVANRGYLLSHGTIERALCEDDLRRMEASTPSA